MQYEGIERSPSSSAVRVLGMTFWRLVRPALTGKALEHTLGSRDDLLVWFTFFGRHPLLPCEVTTTEDIDFYVLYASEKLPNETCVTKLPERKL